MFWILLSCSEPKEVTDTGVPSPPSLSIPLGEDEVRVGIVSEESALFAGVSSEGQVGDFKMYNNRAQFIIQSDRESSYYIQEGGGVIDADIIRPEGVVGRDVIDEHTVMAGLGRILKPTSFEMISDGSNGLAHLRVYGTGVPFELLQGAIENYDLVVPYDMTFQIDYTLRPDSPLLRIESTINWDDDSVPIQCANVMLVGKEVLHNWNPGGGFAGDSDNTWHALISHHDEIAVALMSESEPFASSILQDILTQATPALSSFTPSEIMEEGESTTFVQLLGVGADISSLSDAWYAHNEVPTEVFSGTISDTQGNPISGARVQVYDEEQAITMTQTNAGGEWSVQVPTGIQPRFIASGRGTGIFYDIPLEAGWSGPYTTPTKQEEVLASYNESPATVQSFARGYGVGEWNQSELTAPGNLSIEIEDGGPAVVKIFSITGDTPSPFTPAFPHGATQIAYIRDGSITVPVEPGVYRVFVHRGTKYSMHEEEVEITSTEEYSMTASLDAISIPYSVFGLDGHSHSAPSGDGKVSMEGRLMSHVAHGIDIFVSTEHDHAIDFAPLLSSLGLGEYMQTIVGSEVSPPMRGHFNVYPIVPNPEEPNNGSPIWWNEARDTPELFELMFAVVEEGGVVQANHPVGNSGLFGSASYDLNFGEIDKPDYWSPDFSAFELLNDGHYQSVLPYYIDMLSRGMSPTPTGVSDSHTSESGVGINKTYVFAENSTQESILRALHENKVVVSRGPLVVATVDSSVAFGKTFVGGQELMVEVFAPDWMEIETVRIYENGVVIHDVGYLGTDLEFSLLPSEDAHYLVSISGGESLNPIYGESPWAMGAAFYIDIDGSGWSPSLPPLSE